MLGGLIGFGGSARRARWSGAIIGLVLIGIVPGVAEALADKVAVRVDQSGAVGGGTLEDLTASLRACGLTAGPEGRVVGVVDGDTVRLSTGREVRLVGIQAPKLPLGRKNFEAWPLSDEAKDALQGVVRSGQVKLFYGQTREDRHGRILAHLVAINADGTAIWTQGSMLEAGLARVYTFDDNRACAMPLLAREKAARSAGRGIWSDPYYSIRRPTQTWPYIDTFQVVEGRVLDVSEVSSGVYLNFGENWREDFTIFVPKSALRRFDEGSAGLLSLKGQQIRTRGWLKLRNGPMIDLTHPEQLEVVEG